MSKHNRLLAQAGGHLEPGERILAAVTGIAPTRSLGNNTVRAGCLIATDRRIIRYIKKLGGHDLESFPYHTIASLEAGKTFTGANFVIHASGNSTIIKSIRDGDPQQFEHIARDMMHRARTHTTPPDPATSTADEITKLAALLERGLITRTQYDTQAARLMH